MGDESLGKRGDVRHVCVAGAGAGEWMCTLQSHVPKHRWEECRSSQRVCEALRGCILCLQAECLLHPDTDGWNFTSEELWAMNQFSIYPHVF